MYNNSEAFEALKEYMVSIHNAKVVSGGKEINKRCHICGDSIKDMRSKHMYIGIDNRSGLIVYNCFKCGSSGLVDGKFLRNLDSMHDVSSIAMLCNSHNKDKMNLPQNKLLRDSEYIRLPNPVFWTRDSKESHSKLNNINKRLGTSFTFDDLGKYKIIINLKDFLYANNINMISRSESVVEHLDMFYSGFLSVDNTYITLRRMVREGVLPEFMDKRYINYNIFNKINNANRHYIIPCNINLLDPRPVKIYIAEGPFDTLSLKVNVVKDDDHTIFAAVGGKSYLVLVKYFIEEYGMTNVEYHLCPDADVPDSKMYWIANILRPLGIRVYIHRNNFPGEKDFGVSHDKINEIIKPLF